MFVELDDLKSGMYAHQIDQITEGDDDIAMMGLSSAIDEARSYIAPNGKGIAPNYNVAEIFAKTGTDRSALLVTMIKSIAIWYIIELCNAELIYESKKDRYDRAINWLKSINSGDTTMSDWPVIAIDPDTDQALPWRSGSRTKFIHE